MRAKRRGFQWGGALAAFLAAPLPATQSPPLRSALALAFLIASRSVQLPSPAVGSSAVLLTVMVAGRVENGTASTGRKQESKSGEDRPPRVGRLSTTEWWRSG